MKQKKQKVKNTQPINVAALCTLDAKYPCSAIKRQRKAIKKGKRKRRERRHGSLAAKKISFKD